MSSRTFVDSTNLCLEAFHELLSSPIFGDESAQKQLARFNYWAANIGVFAPPGASLDTRLGHKNGANYRRLLLQLLDVLEKNLHAAAKIPAGDTDDEAAKVTSHEDTLQAVSDIISSLHRLSACIRRSAARDRSSKAADFIERDEEGNNINSVFRENVTRALQHRFPEASRAVCEQLGESISLRRRRVLYSRRHQVKLSVKPHIPVPTQIPVPVIVPDNNPVSVPVTSDPTPNDRALSEPTPVAMSVRPSETAASIPDSDTGGSTIAPSRASSASTGSMIQDQNLRYPSPPRIDPQTGEASCPYCSAALSKDEFLNTKNWRRHLKRDIEPFVCIAESCIGPVRFFHSFKLWSKHIQQEHRVQWHCSMATHRPIVFSDKETFEDHMSTEHTGTLNQSQISTLVRRGARPATRAFDECPLCKAQNADVNSEGHRGTEEAITDHLSRHVAGHLKVLALMFLPPDNDPREQGIEDEGSSTKKSSTKGDVDSIFEHPLSYDEGDGFQGEKYDDTEWQFVPRADYHGHDQDPALKCFILRQLEIDTEGSQEAGVTDDADDLDIVQSLRFAEISYRHHSISDAYPQTFELVYGDISPWSNFREWLQSGSGCYWINGKPGSGKSTLMKFIFGNSKTREALEIWASSPATRAPTHIDLEKRQPLKSNLEVGKALVTADTSMNTPRLGPLGEIARRMRTLRLSRTIAVEDDPGPTQLSAEPSEALPEIYVHDPAPSDRFRTSGASDSENSRLTPPDSSIPMLIKSQRDPTPPLPPPRHLAENNSDKYGPDIAWQWANSHEDSRDLRKSLAFVQSGSSLYGSFAGRMDSLDEQPDNFRPGRFKAEFSTPWILPVFVLLSRKDTNKQHVPKEAKCAIDTGNHLGNLVSQDFVLNVLQCPELSFNALTEEEKKGGTSNSTDRFVPENAIYLTWYHTKSTRVFRNMRFLICPLQNVDLIIGARSIDEQVLVDVPALGFKKGPSVYTAAYFFWGSGTSLQRSESGMLRSLLYQIIIADPVLMPEVITDRWVKDLQAHPTMAADTGRTWDIQKLRQAFQRLLNVTSEELRFCFFIDGLDEADGFQIEDATYLRSRNPFVKFCISSRPWVAFEDAFRNSPSLRLQDLTAPDIQVYVESRLGNDEDIEQLAKYDPAQVNYLIGSIVAKSNGVFLWVSLVVRSVLEGLRHGDNLVDIKRRVNQLPADLENLYEQMISNISPMYKDESGKIFQIVHQMADQNDATFLCCALWGEHFEVKDFQNLMERLRRTLQSRTAGLIELHLKDGSNLAPWKRATVSYIDHNVRYLVERSGQFSQPHFHPDAVLQLLLKACVSTLDPSHVDASWNAMDYIHDRWHAACSFAKGMNNRTVEIQLEQLGEFDKAATNLTSQHRHGKEKTHLHWSNYQLPEYWEMDFLCALVEAHLWLPLRWKLRENPLLVHRKPGKPEQPPLLAFAFLILRKGDFKTKLSTLGDVLEVLFDFGANPNGIFNGAKMWQYFINMLHASAPCHHSQLERIFRLFLTAGADPFSSCIYEASPVWPTIRDEVYIGQKINRDSMDGELAGISVRNLMQHSSTDAFEDMQISTMFPHEIGPHNLPVIVHDLWKGLSPDDRTLSVLYEMISLARTRYIQVESNQASDSLDKPSHLETLQTADESNPSQSSSAEPGSSAPSRNPTASREYRIEWDGGERERLVGTSLEHDRGGSFFFRNLLSSRGKWPDPESSIGAPLSPLGSYQCWEVVGPAKDLWHELGPQIRALVETSMAELRHEALVYSVIMTGKNQKTARPTILIRSSNKEVRQRALKLLKQSSILDAHPGLKVAESPNDIVSPTMPSTFL